EGPQGTRRHPRSTVMSRTRVMVAAAALAPASLLAQASTTPAPAPATAALAARVDAAPPGHVQFHFAARAGVCGNGRTWIQTTQGNITGSYTVTSSGDGVRSEPCEPGPVRVLLDRAERQVIA